MEDNIPEGYMAVDADSEGHIKVTVKSGQYENEPVRIVKIIMDQCTFTKISR